MQEIDTLILGVEASVALAGFAGIIATFQFRDGKKFSRVDAVGLTMIVQFSLLGALICAIPLTLLSFGAAENTTWAITSTLGAIFYVSGMYSTHRYLKEVKKGPSFRLFILVINIINCLCIILHLMNALGIVYHREFGPVIFGLTWTLTITGLMFSRLLLRPVWRQVRAREAEISNNTG